MGFVVFQTGVETLLAEDDNAIREYLCHKAFLVSAFEIYKYMYTVHVVFDCTTLLFSRRARILYYAYYTVQNFQKCLGNGRHQIMFKPVTQQYARIGDVLHCI